MEVRCAKRARFKRDPHQDLSLVSKYVGNLISRSNRPFSSLFFLCLSAFLRAVLIQRHFPNSTFFCQSVLLLMLLLLLPLLLLQMVIAKETTRATLKKETTNQEISLSWPRPQMKKKWTKSYVQKGTFALVPFCGVFFGWYISWRREKKGKGVFWVSWHMSKKGALSLMTFPLSPFYLSVCTRLDNKNMTK